MKKIETPLVVLNKIVEADPILVQAFERVCEWANQRGLEGRKVHIIYREVKEKDSPQTSKSINYTEEECVDQ